MPGGYQVRLTIGDWAATRRFRITPDPRNAPSGVTVLDLQQQLQTALATRDFLSDVRRFVATVAEARKHDSSDRLAALAKTLTAGPGRYPTPQLAEHAAYLYRMTLQADQRMGRDVTERLAELKGQLAKAKTEFAGIRRP